MPTPPPVFASYHRVVDLLTHTSDENLTGYFGMTPQSRDLIASGDAIFQANSDEKVLTMAHSTANNFISVSYNPLLADCDPNALTQIMAHEISHIDQGHKRHDNLYNQVFCSVEYSRYQQAASDPSGIVMFSLTGMLSIGGIPGGLAGLAAHSLSLYPARLNELKADQFAAKVIPEMPYCLGEFLKNSSSMAGSQLEPDQTEQYARSADGDKLLHLFSSHPSNQTREAHYAKNKEMYLAEKQRLGIRSLYIPH